MWMSRWILLVAWTLLARSRCEVSFYGKSYVHVPFEEASSDTRISLHFKTHRPHGLLLLAAGEPDFFSVQLRSGTIQVQFDLGSGDFTLHSQPTLRLDDLQWHIVNIEQLKESVVLTIDDVSPTSVKIPGQFYELNIQSGVFLGGTGSSSTYFSDIFQNFRGCLRDVFFNDHDILKDASLLKDPLNIFEISWSCDAEFDASSDQPISLLSETSFIAFPHLRLRETGALSFDIRTRTKTGLILFNEGRSPSPDFVAMEIINGHVLLSVNNGNGVIELSSNFSIADGKWHSIDVTISALELHMKVDGNQVRSRFNLGDKRYFDLNGHLFIGGIGLEEKQLAMKKGLKSLQTLNNAGSTKGCYRNIIIDSRVFGFRDIQISREIEPSCLWKYPCASNPCVSGAQCKEVDQEEYTCSCASGNCKKAPISTPGSGEMEDRFDLVAIQALTIKEGTKAKITRTYINVVFNYEKYQLKESDLHFKVKLPPRHGHIKIISSLEIMQTFTLLDVLQNSVVYLHDGTETVSDDITIELEINANGHHLPAQLYQKYAFVFPIHIIPRNDPPILRVAGGQLKLIQNSKMQIRNTVLSVDDPDNDPSDLVYYVKYQASTGIYFEKAEAPGHRIATFTQEEINNGEIWFVHKDQPVNFVQLHVNDGLVNSRVQDLKVYAKKLKLKLQNNTGIFLPQSSYALILPQNLSVSTNVPHQNIEIRYMLNKVPKVGEIQRKKYENDRWIPVSTFAQRHIDAGRIRYFHKNFDSFSRNDSFGFIVTAMESQSEESIFIINFEEVKVDITTNKKLVLKHVNFRLLSVDNLKVKINTPKVSPRNIIFTVIRPPSYGNLYKVETLPLPPVSFEGLNPIQKDGTFTQADITANRTYYKLQRNSYKHINDFMDCRIHVNDAPPKLFRLLVEYIPKHADVRFINNGLEGIIEGDKKVIRREDLYIETDKHREFHYIIMKPPSHGSLLLVDPRSSIVMKKDVIEFSNRNIREGKLVYKHDDSEHDKDTFTFSAIPRFTSSKKAEELPEFSGNFPIKIIMRNDNSPVQLVEKVFHVVTGKQRLITISDLAFTDPDIDFDSRHLQYTQNGIPNGKIIDVLNKSNVYRFSQQQIIEKRLMFQHHGAVYGQFAFWVTDGQFRTNGLFEVEASGPFIKIANNTGIAVLKGQTSKISSINISVSTNVNAYDDKIIFTVLEKPQGGKLTIRDKEVNEFNFADIINNAVNYVHEGRSSLDDHFKFSVQAGDAEVEGTFTILVFLESQQHPPHVVHNKILVIDDGKSMFIDQSHLHISHPDSLSSDIRYQIINPPKYGKLQLVGREVSDDQELTFSQDDINHKKLKYVHTLKKATETDVDGFIFDVTNGFQMLHGLEFVVEILPKVLPVRVLNVTVQEGKKKLITKENVKIKGRHFEGKLVSYKIVRQPAYGWLESKTEQRHHLSSFTSQELLDELVYYVHDDSETTHDEFVIVGKLVEDGRESEIKMLHVNIQPVNDQIPTVVVNKGIEVWNQSITLLTNKMLKATDLDSGPEELVFKVVGPSNGHLALVNDTYKEILTFNQAMVDQNLVAFVHTGGTTGQFSFQVSDGASMDVLRIFRIKAKPLLLSLIANKHLKTYPNTMQQVTAKHLFSSTNNPNQTRPIVYSLESKPKRGQLVTIVNNKPMEAMSFTQAEVNRGKVFYKHTARVLGWSQEDSFYFQTSTLYAEPIKDLFLISIAYGNLNSENKAQLIHLKPLNVEEGEESRITKDNLNVMKYVRQLENVGKHVHIEYKITKLPKYGILQLDGMDILKESAFTQNDIDTRELLYVHDGSDTQVDFFEFYLDIKIRDVANDAGDSSTTLANVFNITIIPVNDQKFELITKNPSIQVVQGLSTNITSKDLKTIDPDTVPDELMYKIVTGPTNGKLVYYNNQQTSINQFSQKDIDDEKVTFIHDGSRNFGAFNFRVSDGKFSPFYKIFNIRVVLISIKVMKQADVEVIQSESSAYISTKNLEIYTNGLYKRIHYNVTQSPQFGHLYFKDSVVSHFTQNDLESKLLLYVQTDLTSGSDFLLVHMYIPDVDSDLYSALINITVVPLVKQQPFIANAGSETFLTTAALDAGELAALTNDNPRYVITVGPIYGRLLKSSIAKRDVKQSGIHLKTFSHDDILKENIYYEADFYGSLNNYTDSFSFILSAKNVQPAAGTFRVSVHPPFHSSSVVSVVYPRTRTTNKTESTFAPGQGPSTTDVLSPSISNDHLVVTIVVAFILLIIIIVLIIFILLRRKKYKQNTEHVLHRPRPRPHISGPLHLEQPHVHIEPQQSASPVSDDDQFLVTESPSGNIPVINVISEEREESTEPVRLVSPPRSPDLTRMEISTAVPTCKVTPLVDNDDPDNRSPVDSAKSNNSADLFNFDWTLLDPELLQHCRTSNPVLRKNQYWV